MKADPNDMLAFLALARARTHLAAGAALEVSHTTIARRVQRLESAIGCRLLIASASGWELTREGRSLVSTAETIEQAMGQAAGIDFAGDAQPHGRVRVNTTEVFGTIVAAPALTAVQNRYLGISMELTFLANRSAAFGPNFDIDIGYRRPRQRNLQVIPLPAAVFSLYASREYLAARPMPRTLDDMAEHVWIRYIDELPFGDRVDPSLAQPDMYFVRARQVIGAASMLAQYRMVVGGAGIGYLPHHLVQEGDDLVRVLPEIENKVRYWLRGQPETLRRREVMIVVRSIQERANVILGRLPQTHTDTAPAVNGSIDYLDRGRRRRPKTTQ